MYTTHTYIYTYKNAIQTYHSLFTPLTHIHILLHTITYLYTTHRLTDSQGRTVSFKNCLLIMTSNIGSNVIAKGGGSLGFVVESNEEDSQYTRIRTLVMEELKVGVCGVGV